jgi:hypothetical protein
MNYIRDDGKRLRRALKRRDQAAKDVDKILREDFPAGKRVSFMGSRNIVYPAKVLTHGFGGRIKVENLHTGRERWLYAERLHV